MKKHLNTLFITTENTYLHQDGAAIEVRRDGAPVVRVPLHNLEGIACFGWNITASAALMRACAENGVALTFCSPNGRFFAAVNGFTSGNIRLRRAQYRTADTPLAALDIARNCIAAKIANARTVLMRALRDHGDTLPAPSLLQTAAARMGAYARDATTASSADTLRGVEGEAAAVYFSVFNDLLTVRDAPEMRGRNRRPPRDPVNALLSFLYTLLMHDCRSALERAGLDAQCGFLHTDRPGRPSLALDLMEEFRPVLADRLALSLFNRRQVSARDFLYEASGAVMLKEASRKTVLAAWQERKQETLEHPILEEKCTVGALPHVQALLLARRLRGDIDAYPAFLWR